MSECGTLFNTNTRSSGTNGKALLFLLLQARSPNMPFTFLSTPALQIRIKKIQGEMELNLEKGLKNTFCLSLLWKATKHRVGESVWLISRAAWWSFGLLWTWPPIPTHVLWASSGEWAADVPVTLCWEKGSARVFGIASKDFIWGGRQHTNWNFHTDASCCDQQGQ